MIEQSKLDTTQQARPAKRPAGPITRTLRVLYIIAAWLFALGVLIQTYLAGMGIFVNASWLKEHSGLGWSLAELSILSLILLFPCRFPRKIILLHLLLILDIIFQVGLVSFFHGFNLPLLTALHPMNAVLLFVIATLLAYNTLIWTRSTRRKAGA
ncbi:DUF6220 domain-containing protein [Ktedonospora formicarum]|uniref:Uncharacterized protein n=1 Tax=Ktedonospora formicarum TaxID=2778364 RepID=A0A8J3I9H6_9CHLR|nr:DUF6220 domain-containing protein [Ktedonospora formicarum]GHO49290.1 hypothetical protein KSX_74530 [Ktedonospora formicarum]